jgi:hypothetical protein
MLRIDDISYAIAGNPLFEGASATIPAGHKVGIVGRNGAGKTTLFRLIRGELTLDGGTISLPPRARIGGVAQEAPGTEVSLLDTVLAADEERAALLAEAETATDPDRIAEVQTRLADIDAWSGEARASPSSRAWASRPNSDALLRLLGRLADARGAGRRAVRAARPAAAGRADQLPRPRRRALAGKLPGALPAHGADHQPRPRPAEPRGGSHPASGGPQADALPAATTRLRPRPRRDARRAGGRRQEAGGRARASAGLRRPVRQGVQGETGAEPREDAGADDSRSACPRTPRAPFWLPRARGAVAAHREPRWGRGGL